MPSQPTPETATQPASPQKEVRTLSQAKPGEDALGPLENLPGTWRSCGRGWNMIALPFPKGEQDKRGYRLLLNQYNEILKFTTVDKNIPNRGIPDDQVVAALDYEQTIEQIADEDFPKGGEAGLREIPIHHEPGLWLHMRDERTDKLDIARLATIPHGDSVLALGKSSVSKGTFEIPDISGLPEGFPLTSDYLIPYRNFDGDNKFKGAFTPVKPNQLLMDAQEEVTIKKVTTLEVDTKIETGGINNIPFVTKQANAARMTSTFWIQEIEDSNGPGLRLQYTQTVFLDFAKILWPHVSINTLKKD